MIRNLNINGEQLWFVADDMGMPVSPGYPSEQEAEEAEELIAVSEGMAALPVGVDIEAALAAARKA